mmetsp:Transcript_37015/g.78161  ORF Transcript_37015/g.78161 Transcript_37015/m.78161 type:complete len:288 (+) Transcript_37015:236-1099(+)
MMVPTNNRNGHYHDSLGPGATALHAMGQIDTNVAHQQQDATATGDLLGFGSAFGFGTPTSPQPTQQQQVQQQSTQQAQQQQHVINATQATVSITTSGGGAAPTIAGLGKIEPSANNNAQMQMNNNRQQKPKRKVIYVPTYSCNGGLDTKFNHHARHARPSHLHGLLTPQEYETSIRTLNAKIKSTRAKKVDVALLATGALMVPLAVWGARHGRQVKKRRTLIEEGVWEFNERMAMESNGNGGSGSGRNVIMVWNRAKVVGGGESYLTIEERESEHDGTTSRGNKKMD